jgi:hypothetical protein
MSRFSPAQKARNRLAIAARYGTPADVEAARAALAEAKIETARERAEAKLAERILEVVEDAPPLTAEQRERLALLLNSGSAAQASS